MDKSLIECELRGPITWSDFNDIKSSVEKKWGPLTHFVELVVFFKGEHDLRLKINNNGVELVLKKTVKKSEAKSEVVFKSGIDQLENAVSLVYNLGFTEGLFSYVEKYEAVKNNKSISFKFGSQIGDFFEIEELVTDGKKVNAALKRIKRIVRQHGLLIWDKKVYQNLIKNSWKDVRPQKLIDAGKISPRIREVYARIQNSRNKNLRKKNVTISDLLKSRSNDYTDLESKYKDRVKLGLLTEKFLPRSVEFTKQVSIVIPTYNSVSTLQYTLESIKNQYLTSKERKLIEVIVVDDGSPDNSLKVVDKYSKHYPLKYFRQNNMGRGQARNAGAVLASGGTLIFVDSDIILEKHFIREHAIRHELLDKIVLISFKENIGRDDKRLRSRDFFRNLPKPDFSRDFRFEKEVKPEWLRMHRHVRNVEVRKVRIMEETNYLKNFGKDKVIGVWDLPSVVVTNAVSMKTKEFRAIGGFNLQFRGWGMEDTFLGACLISQGNYVIPVINTGVYHLEHPPRSGTRETMMQEFNRNVLVYLDLLHLPLHEVIKDPGDE